MRAYVPTCSRDGTASGGAKPRLGAGVGGSHDDVLTREFARSSKQVPLKAHQCGGDGREASVRFAAPRDAAELDVQACTTLHSVFVHTW